MFQVLNKHMIGDDAQILSTHKKSVQLVLVDEKNKVIENEFFEKTLGTEKKKIEQAIEDMAFKPNSHQCLYINHFWSSEKNFGVLVIGQEQKLNPLAWQMVGKSIAQDVEKKKIDALFVPSEIAQENDTGIGVDAMKDLWTGFYATIWVDRRFKSKKSENKIPAIYHNDEKSTESINQHLLHVEAMLSAKAFGNAPANILTTTAFMEEAKKLSGGSMTVRVLDRKELEKENMNLLLGVGNSSKYPPYLVVLEWKPEGTEEERPLALVGKGVCFDTGGVNLKPSSAILGMKYDMCGAAAVVATMQACKKLNVKKRVIGVLALVENAIDNNAIRPDDILTSRSGKTVTIMNTDAEGRLILADAIDYTIDEYDPHTLIDLATLTGAITISLGSQYAGLFSNDDKLAQDLFTSGIDQKERVWRLPLGPEYSEMIKNEYSDIQNLGSPDRAAGSITAACFIEEFIKNDVKWAHIDIAGTANPSKHPIHKGCTGYGPMLLLDYINKH